MTYYLNHVQQLQLKLKDLYPYNAIHFITLDPLIEKKELHQAIIQTLKKIKLGTPAFSNKKKQTSFENTNLSITLKDIYLAPEQHAQQELNNPFHENELPLRFFIVHDLNNKYFTLTYDHWLTDGFSATKLIFAILNQLKNTESSLQLATHDMQYYFKKPNIFSFFTFMNMVSKNIYTFKSAFRTPQKKEKINDTYTESYTFSSKILNKLITISKQNKVTMNDLFITLLIRIFALKTKNSISNIRKKRLKPKRDNLVVSVSTNIRPYSHLNLTSIFNQYLGYFTLSFKKPEQLSLSQLLKITHKKTAKIKRKKEAMKNIFLFKLSHYLWNKSRNHYRFFYKNAPFTFGISNININYQQPFTSDSKFIRFSPSSYICPLVFNFTTFNNNLILTITATDNIYTTTELKELKNEIVNNFSNYCALNESG